MLTLGGNNGQNMQDRSRLQKKDRRPNRNMGKRLDRAPCEGNPEMTKGHTERCPSSLVTGKCKLQPQLYTRVYPPDSEK